MLFDAGVGGWDCRQGGSGLGYEVGVEVEVEDLEVDLAQDLGFRGIVGVVESR